MQQQRNHLHTLAGKVIDLSLSNETRSEVLWLQERYQDFLKASGLKNRRQGDMLLAQRMNASPGSPAEISGTAVLKVRYWRTGKHYPKNRDGCAAFGQALGLNAEDRRFLMTDWFNRSDMSFTPEDIQSAEYLQRIQLLKKLQQEFLDKQRPEEFLAMCAPGTRPHENLRYIYCRNALRYLGTRARLRISEPLSHLDTRAYEYQFSREMKLLGEISRSAMIRHLLILGMPFVSRERINGWLTELGFAPLNKTHRLPDGSAQDLMILGLLELYEKECTGLEPHRCTEWFRQTAGLFDDILDTAGCGEVNPFRFKHIMGGTNA